MRKSESHSHMLRFIDNKTVGKRQSYRIKLGNLLEIGVCVCVSVLLFSSRPSAALFYNLTFHFSRQPSNKNTKKGTHFPTFFVENSLKALVTFDCDPKILRSKKCGISIKRLVENLTRYTFFVHFFAWTECFIRCLLLAKSKNDEEPCLGIVQSYLLVFNV